MPLWAAVVHGIELLIVPSTDCLAFLTWTALLYMLFAIIQVKCVVNSSVATDLESLENVIELSGD